MLKNSTNNVGGNGPRSFIRRLAAEKERCKTEVTDQWENLCHHGSEIKSSLSKKNFEGGSPNVIKVAHLQYMISEDEVDDGHYSSDDFESQGRVQIELSPDESSKVVFVKSPAEPAYPEIRRRFLDMDAYSVTPEPASTRSLRSSISSVSVLDSIELDLSGSDFDTCDDEQGEDNVDNCGNNRSDQLQRQVSKVKEQVVDAGWYIETLKEEFQSLSKEFKAWESRQLLHNLNIRRLSQGLQELARRRSSHVSAISTASVKSEPETRQSDPSSHPSTDSPENCETPMMFNHKITCDSLTHRELPSEGDTSEEVPLF